MKIVIEIPEEEYNECRMQVELMKQEGIIIESLNTALRIFVANGIPLPKGHRGIVDLKSVQWAFDDAILEEAQKTGQVRATYNEIASILETIPKIVEADRTESEDKE